MDLHTESPTLLKNFSLLVGRKPNFDSVLKLMSHGKEASMVRHEARKHQSWATLDAGWIFSPPGILGIKGRVFGMSPDIMAVVTKHLGLRIKYHFKSNYGATSWVLKGFFSQYCGIQIITSNNCKCHFSTRASRSMSVKVVVVVLVVVVVVVVVVVTYSKFARFYGYRWRI